MSLIHKIKSNIINPSHCLLHQASSRMTFKSIWRAELGKKKKKTIQLDKDEHPWTWAALLLSLWTQLNTKFYLRFLNIWSQLYINAILHETSILLLLLFILIFAICSLKKSRHQHPYLGWSWSNTVDNVLWS